MKRALFAVCFLVFLIGKSADKSASFFDKLVGFLGVTSTPSALRGEEQVNSGDVWVVGVAPKQAAQRLTRDAGYRSPVFDLPGDSIFAIKSNELYRIPVNREPASKVYALVGVSKLVGCSRDDPDQLLVITNEPQGAPFAAILSIKTGTQTRIADGGHSDQYRAMLTQLTGWERVYGTTHVYTEHEEKPGAGDSTIEFSDVYLRRGNDVALNLTNGNGISRFAPLSEYPVLLVPVRKGEARLILAAYD
jgi:hypothetical protein